MIFSAVLLLLAFLLPAPLAAEPFDPYALIEAYAANDKHPRVLNSDDIKINPTDPQPLFTPDGDFNGDGIQDMAIAGIYDLPTDKKKYFLLVGTQWKAPIRYERWYFQEYDHPVFLHKAGTTGEGDPGNQAFSATDCAGCTSGVDFVWNKKKNAFDQKPWAKRIRRYEAVAVRPASQPVPDEVVDHALQVVGALKDVQFFVAGLKKKKGQLGTRVESTWDAPVEERVKVLVFEKKEKTEKMYDVFTVDLKTDTILKRRLKIKK